MARKTKILLEGNIDKREVGYYSTPEFVANYLAQEMIQINPNGRYVLDPAVGKEELVHAFYNAGKIVDSYDIIDFGNHQHSNFCEMNFIDVYEQMLNDSFFQTAINSKYDYIIANPPYNCHEVQYIHDNKKRLNALFKVGAYNMYSMFLSALIDIAKDGCLIGVIVSDSFLTSSYHNKLRQQIFDSCSIHQIILCPSDLFWSQKADVRTCILILQKGRSYQGSVSICNRPRNAIELEDILANHRLKKVSLNEIRLSKNTTLNQFLIDVSPSIISLIHTNPSLGSLYKCVTCISTGNDKKYLSKDKVPGFSIPFYKNPASRKFVTEPDAFLIDDFMGESLIVKDFMVRNKSLLSQEGVVCSSMGLPFSAAYLPEDGVSGVNPTIFPPKDEIYWLIAYLNSSFVTYIVRGVLIRSNMITSGYVSHIPIITFSEEEKNTLATISKNVIDGVFNVSQAIELIDKLIFAKDIFPKEVESQIYDFCRDLQRRV